MKKRSISFEVAISVAVNLIIFGALLFAHHALAPPPSPPEIAVDISNFTPPAPEIMEKSRPSENDTESGGFSRGSGTASSASSQGIEGSAAKAMVDFTPSTATESLLDKPTQAERSRDLARFEKNFADFDGVAKIKTELPASGPPAGAQIGQSFTNRTDARKRANAVRRHGGSEQTENAVQKSLRYLASKQNKDGSWGSKDSIKTGDFAALSSLAMLTFFAHGENFQSTTYAETVRKGADFLVDTANTADIEYVGAGFGHAILTYALAEGYGISGSLSLRNALEKRLKVMIAKQNKFGSFALAYNNAPQAPLNDEQKQNPIYREVVPGEPNCDLSLLGWHIQAMAAAYNAGIRVDGLEKALTLATESLIKIHQADKGGFSQGINMRKFPQNENMTPVGLLGLQLLNASTSTPAKRAEKLVADTALPKWKKSAAFPLYRWYYQTQNIFYTERGRGRKWDNWNNNMKKELTVAQRGDGGWNMPGGDNSFRLRNQDDLSIYSTSLCSLMLQVYYRYLPEYSIAETAKISGQADELDLGGPGLITRLPGGADPMGQVMLGIGSNTFTPIRIGKFDNRPASVEDALVADEFTIHAGMRSTMQVRQPRDWPQTLQPNQRIAVFFDDFLPRGYKGHLRLRLGLIGDEKKVADFQNSLEVVFNGKRLHYSFLRRNHQLLELIIPGDIFNSSVNICQIRNNGKSIVAFDAVEFEPVGKIGERIRLLAGNRKELPADIRHLFGDELPDGPEVLKLSPSEENCQLLPMLKEYLPGKEYAAQMGCFGSEYMGDNFQLHYLRTSALQIIDWIAGGGTALQLNYIATGGKFYDSIFRTEYPALSALRQAAKLFDGTAYKLPCQISPSYGDKPLLFTNAAAAYNGPGVATVVIAKRFPIPEETEVLALIPWDGETEITIEKGLLPATSIFPGFATKIAAETKPVVIKDGLFRYSAVLPELTVIRLTKKGSKPLKSGWIEKYVPPSVKFDNNSVKMQTRKITPTGLKTAKLREEAGFFSSYGANSSAKVIPVTPGDEQFKPDAAQSVLSTFSLAGAVKSRHDSVYLTFGNGPDNPISLSFDIFVRANSSQKNDRFSLVPFRFALDGKCFGTRLPPGRWLRLTLPLDGINPYWKSLRILEPGQVLDRNVQSISYEINNVTVQYR